jgi:hypothetical protein
MTDVPSPQNIQNIIQNAPATPDAQAAQNTQNAPATPDAQAAQDTQAAQNAQAIPSNPAPASKSDPLDDLIAAIRTAVARAVGATACRAILTALEAKAGQPLAAAPPTAPTATSPLAAMLSQLAAMPREQMLEFITNFLRTKLPQTTQPQVIAGPRFHLIQIPPVHGRGSGS